MEAALVEALFILVVGALPCATLGYLIAFKGKRGLIAGYSEAQISNPKAYGKGIGLSLILLSIGLCSIALGRYIQLLSENQIALSIAIMSLAVIISAIYCSIKYKVKN